MNPADLSINTSALTGAKPVPAPLITTQKNGRLPIPRVDLEPIYTQLKAALGDHWADYKAAISAFILGNFTSASTARRVCRLMVFQANSTKPSSHGSSNLSSPSRLLS